MSKIEWTGKTWNPITGCSRISPGCQNCYAEKMARRLKAMGKVAYQDAINSDGRWTGKIRVSESALDTPLRRKKPTVWFVDSMSDLFHKKVDITIQTYIFEIMAKTPQHTYQILTKRADRLMPLWNEIGAGVAYRLGEQRTPGFWPLKNVWLGVSVENQQYADERIPFLLQTPATVRFLSCEPLLGPLELWKYLANNSLFKAKYWGDGNISGQKNINGTITAWDGERNQFEDGLDIHWVIIGGESGPGAREFRMEWAGNIVSQCKSARVPVFVKQMGDNATWDSERMNNFGPKGKEMSKWPEYLQVREFPV